MKETTPTLTAAIAPINVDQDEAAQLTGLSAKTLGRLADAGEPLGRFKIGRRVLFHRETLNAWFKERASAARQPGSLDRG